jgi:hypothetical protein
MGLEIQTSEFDSSSRPNSQRRFKMNPSIPTEPGITPRSGRVRPKTVTAYLILSLIVTAIAALVFLIVGSPLGGLKLERLETIPFMIMLVINLVGLVATIALFFWRKWAAIVFYILLGLSLLWFGYSFLIQEGLNLFNIAGFFCLGILPILIFRWAIQKIWLQLI